MLKLNLGQYNSVFKDLSYKILWKSDRSKCNRELKKVYFIATKVDGDR